MLKRNGNSLPQLAVESVAALLEADGGPPAKRMHTLSYTDERVFQLR